MPAKSESQRRLMGMALAYKRGRYKDASKEVKDVADGMSEKQLLDFMKLEESAPEVPVEDPKKCVCHNCGNEEEHTPGLPCQLSICQHCGMPLFGNDDPPSSKVRKYVRNAIRYLMMKDVE